MSSFKNVLIFVCLLAAGGVVLAETDYRAMAEIRRIRDGLTVLDTPTAKDLQISGRRAEVPQTVAVSNGDVIASTWSLVLAVPTGTCTNTVALPGIAGMEMTIINRGSGTMLFVNDNSTFAIGASNITLATNDVMTLVAPSVSGWVRKSSADNN